MIWEEELLRKKKVPLRDIMRIVTPEAEDHTTKNSAIS